MKRPHESKALSDRYLIVDYSCLCFLIVLCPPVCLNVALCAGGEGPLKRSFDEHFTQLRPLVLQRSKGRNGGMEAQTWAWSKRWPSPSTLPGPKWLWHSWAGAVEVRSCRVAKHSFVCGQRDLNSIKMRQRRGNNADKLASGPWFFLYVSCCQFPP